jgi:micrococcal nuclease
MSVATKMPIAAAVYTAALVLAGCSSSEPMQTALPQTGPAQDPTGATAEVPEAIGEPANVTRVIDGDTIEVALDNEIITVRLIGIDTPETVHPTEPVECYGPAASRFTTGALQGRPVRLEFDVERIDRYGRTLAYVWLGAELFNETLVARGFAQVTTYPPNVKYVDRFLAAQRDARSHERGLWGAVCNEPEPVSTGGGGGAGGAGDGPCDPSYPDVCIPPYPPDLDCGDVSFTYFRVEGSDPHGFDGDDDGMGCES